MLFLDGIGIGKNDPAVNPFAAAPLRTLKSLLGGRMVFKADAHRSGAHASAVPLNATLGVPGLPQSGTGQTALLTGMNAARIAGKHFGPYPCSGIRPVLSEYNIFHRVIRAGKSPFYANAFPRQYFEYINAHKSRTAAISSAWLAAGETLNDHRALEAGRALSADITNERWPKLGYPGISPITPQEAGRRLVRFLRDHDFVLYEYYMTDYAGHHQSMHDSLTVLDAIDALLEGIFTEFDESSMLFLLTSDHGNMEDLSVKTHTRNPVPLITAGFRHHAFDHARSLTDIAPKIEELLS